MWKKSCGFTMVETLVAAAVLLIFFAAVGAIIQISMKALGQSRTKAIAAALGREKLELARNLPYNSVGTIGGIPNGTLSQDETVNLNGQDFTIKTSVVYVDDPFDNIAPTDTLPIDYKRVRVAVSWNGLFASKEPLILLTDIASKGVENIENAGTILITVVDANANAISNANVHIEASTVVPAVNLDTLTDVNGRVLLPGAPICDQCYKITVTKSGYTAAKTYGEEEVPIPNKPHLSVIEAEVTADTYVIDRAVTLILKAVRSKATGYTPFQGVQMSVKGQKIIGSTLDGDPVYKINNLYTTGSGGIVTVNDLDWDTYQITLPPSSSVDNAGSWPFNPVQLAPGDNLLFTMVVEPATTNNILVTVKDMTLLPVASASVELSYEPTGFIATESTGLVGYGDYSQVFFSGLNPLTYQLKVMAEGYLPATNSAIVSGDMLENIQLLPL